MLTKADFIASKIRGKKQPSNIVKCEHLEGMLCSEPAKPWWNLASTEFQ